MIREIRSDNIYGFDVENTIIDDEPVITLGSIYSDDYQRTFYSKDEFWSIMKERMFRGKILIGTNVEYDLGLVLNGRPENNIINIIRRGGRIITASVRTTGKNAVNFADTMNFSPQGVKAIGELTGIEKMQQPDSWDPKTPEEWEYLKRYNMQDSKISYSFMKYLMEGLSSLGTTMKLTAASTAMHTWKNNYYDMEFIPSKHADEEMQSYFGGRTEAFQRGRFSNIKVYDFNSMYPFVMATKPIPLPQSVKKLNTPCIDGEGISRCSVVTPPAEDLLIPLLPYRSEKLLFPCGSWKGWYTNVELRRARLLGYKIKPLKTYQYQTDDIFSDYINDLYQLRLKYKKQENEIMQLITKLLMNSLYGRFAIKTETENEVHISQLDPEEVIDHLEAGRTITPNGFIHYKEQMKYLPKYRMPIISSYITAHARLMLYDAIQRSGEENCVYCDTDSIFTTKDLPESPKLGDLKKEFEGEAVIIRPKCYYLKRDDKHKIKVKGLGRIITDPQMFEDHIIRSKPVTFKRLARMKEARRRDFFYGQQIDCHKLMDLEDNKRQWKHRFSAETTEASLPMTIMEDRK